MRTNYPHASAMIKFVADSLCSLFFFIPQPKKKTRRGQVTCSSAKVRLRNSGRIGANTGDQFFCYGRNFDMIYDIHKVKLSVFLLLNWYLLIRYRNQVDLFLNQNKWNMDVLDFVLHLPFWIGVLVGWKVLPYAVTFLKRFIKL